MEIMEAIQIRESAGFVSRSGVRRRFGLVGHNGSRDGGFLYIGI